MIMKGYSNEMIIVLYSVYILGYIHHQKKDDKYRMIEIVIQ